MLLAGSGADCRQALELDELLVVDSFLRKPPPELRVAPLAREAILHAAAQVPLG